MSDLSILLLGSVQVLLNGSPFTQFRTKSVQALLVYLICEAERPHQREALEELHDYRPPVEQTDVDRDIDNILGSIDRETYEAVYAEGVRMTIDQAIAAALEMEIA